MTPKLRGPTNEPSRSWPPASPRYLVGEWGAGGFTAAVLGLPRIQAETPATKKKTMRAIVATANLWSARRDRSIAHFVRRLGFTLSLRCRYRIG
jgi:hypothetical protein